MHDGTGKREPSYGDRRAGQSLWPEAIAAPGWDG